MGTCWPPGAAGLPLGVLHARPATTTQCNAQSTRSPQSCEVRAGAEQLCLAPPQ